MGLGIFIQFVVKELFFANSMYTGIIWDREETILHSHGHFRVEKVLQNMG